MQFSFARKHESRNFSASMERFIVFFRGKYFKAMFVIGNVELNTHLIMNYYKLHRLIGEIYEKYIVAKTGSRKMYTMKCFRKEEDWDETMKNSSRRVCFYLISKGDRLYCFYKPHNLSIDKSVSLWVR